MVPPCFLGESCRSLGKHVRNNWWQIASLVYARALSQGCRNAILDSDRGHPGEASGNQARSRCPRSGVTKRSNLGPYPGATGRQRTPSTNQAIQEAHRKGHAVYIYLFFRTLVQAIVCVCGPLPVPLYAILLLKGLGSPPGETALKDLRANFSNHRFRGGVLRPARASPTAGPGGWWGPTAGRF